MTNMISYQGLVRTFPGGFDVPFLDTRAKELLSEARENFKRYDLDSTTLIEVGSNAVLLFPWSSDIAHDAFVLLMQKNDIDAVNEGIYILINCSKEKMLNVIVSIKDSHVLSTDLLDGVRNLNREKWDWALPDRILRKSFSSLRLDLEGALGICKKVILMHGK